MSNVLFISESRLKSVTSVHENLEPDDLMPFVLQAQDTYIQELLGTKFYQSLKNSVTGATLTAAETTLLDDYISPTLAHYSVYLALPSLNYKIKNKSVLNPSSETSENTTLEELKYLRGTVKDTAEFYRERTREYLRDNQENFNDYINPGVDGMMPDKFNNYSSGIVIPRRVGCGLDRDYLPNNPDPQNI